MISMFSSSMLLVQQASGAAVPPCSVAVARLLPSLRLQGWQTRKQQQQHDQHQQQQQLQSAPPPGTPMPPVQLPLCQVQQLWPAQHQQLLLPPLLFQQFRCLRTQSGRSRPTGPDRQRERHQQQQRPHQQQQQQPRQWPAQRYGSDPAEMTSLIMSADSPRELLERVVLNHQALDHTHIISALQRAAQLWPQTATPTHAGLGADRPRARHLQPQQQPTGGEVALVGRQQLEKLMLQLSGPFIRALPDYSARDVSSALWSYARCNLQPPAELLRAAAHELCSWDKVQKAQPNVVATLAWASSKLGCTDKPLLSHISVAALSGHMQLYTPMQLSNLVWCFSRAAYEDRALGLALTARAVELLQRQQRQQQEQQSGKKGSAIQQAGEWRFTPFGLSNVVAGSAGMGWLSETPELVQLAADVASQAPFVHSFRPMDAASLLWGLATALGGSGPDHQPHHHQQQQGAVSVSSSPVVDAEAVWQASLTVAAAALRRVDEAGAGSLCRLVWSCATLSGWVHKTLAAAVEGAAAADAGAAQRSLADGRVVFDQLCAALAKSWQHEPQAFGQTAAMTAWALIAAEKCGLWRPDAMQMAATAGFSQQQQQQQLPALLLQRLLSGISSHGKASGGQQQLHLTAGTVGDLSAALSELKHRLESYDSLATMASGALGPDTQSTEQPGSSAGQLLVQLSAAVDALAAAAWHHAGTPGALEVRNVSRMLTAFTHLQVKDAGLHRDLLQHWSQEALQGCSSKALIGALRAAAIFSTSQSDLVQSDSLRVQAWEHLLAACKQRWGGLTADEQNRAKGSLRSLCSSGLKGVVGDDMLAEMLELVGKAVVAEA